jgi:probable HAF family extracellular repeat protein
MRKMLLAVSALIAAPAVCATSVQTWRAHDLRGTGAYASYANGVNTAGQVVGTVEGADGAPSGVRFDRDGFVRLGALGGRRSNAQAINDRGAIVGAAEGEDESWHAYLWTPSAGMRDLGTLGGTNSAAVAVNDAGQIAGYSDTDDGRWRGFLHDGEKLIDIGTLGGKFSAPRAMNAHGAIVGVSENAQGYRRAFLYTKQDGMRDLGTFGGRHSNASGINQHGVVVGSALTKSHGWHAFLWDRGQMTDLGALFTEGGSYPDTYALAINDAGQVTGLYIDGGTRRTFVYSQGKMTLLPYDDSLYNPKAMNAGGAIVGERYAIDRFKAAMLLPYWIELAQAAVKPWQLTLFAAFASLLAWTGWRRAVRVRS